MTSAIGFAGAFSSSANQVASVYVDAQLAKCEIQLGDWTACASSNTPAGKAMIADLTSRISELKQQQRAVAAAAQQSRDQANSRSDSTDGIGSVVDAYA